MNLAVAFFQIFISKIIQNIVAVNLNSLTARSPGIIMGLEHTCEELSSKSDENQLISNLIRALEGVGEGESTTERDADDIYFKYSVEKEAFRRSESSKDFVFSFAPSKYLVENSDSIRFLGRLCKGLGYSVFLDLNPLDFPDSVFSRLTGDMGYLHALADRHLEEFYTGPISEDIVAMRLKIVGWLQIITTRRPRQPFGLISAFKLLNDPLYFSENSTISQREFFGAWLDWLTLLSYTRHFFFSNSGKLFSFQLENPTHLTSVFRDENNWKFYLKSVLKYVDENSEKDTSPKKLKISLGPQILSVCKALGHSVTSVVGALFHGLDVSDKSLASLIERNKVFKISEAIDETELRTEVKQLLMSQLALPDSRTVKKALVPTQFISQKDFLQTQGLFVA